MATILAKPGRQLARKVLVFQTFIALTISAFFAIFYGKNAAISAFYGGLTCIIPALLFAQLTFKYAGATQNQQVVRSFNKGNKLKLFLTVIMFVMVYQWQNIQAMPLLISYATCIIAAWPILIFLGRVKS